MTKTIMQNKNIKYSGSCVCGDITYKATDLKEVNYCHCRQCRRMTGHFMAASQVDLNKIIIQGNPKWYYVSNKAKHGFCPNCGCQMFWYNKDNNYLSVTLGSVNDSKNLTHRQHVFVSEKGSYYKIDPQHIQFEKYGNFLKKP